MEGDEDEVARLDALGGQHRLALGPLEDPEEAVDHRVADQLHAVAADSLVGQVLDRVLRGAEQQAGDAVGDDAVDLLGHRPVVAAQSRLDVRNANAAFPRRHRAGECRIDIPGDDHQIGTKFGERVLELCCRALRRARVKLDVRPRQRQLGKEDVFQERVVVLTRVDEPLLDVSTPLERRVDRGHLHVVRPGADDVDDEPSGHQRPASSSGTRTSPGVCSTCRSCQSVKASRAHSWRLRSRRPATWSSSNRCTTRGSK